MAVSTKMRAFAEKSSWIRKMFEEGAGMKAEFGPENIFDFSLGNPDLPPPPEYDQAAQEIVESAAPDAHAYMPNGGYPWVREAIAARISREQEVVVNGGDMLMTCGAAGGLNIIIKSLLNPGDEVIIPAPYFVEYKFYIDNHGGISKVVDTDDDFNLNLQAIEKAITGKTRAVIINSPNNPTGQIYPAEDLARLGELLDRMGRRLGSTIYLIADEPYRRIVFDGHTVPSIFAAYQNSMVVSSFSKDLSLPGERIGYLALHPELDDKAALLDALTLANRILGFVNAPAFMQRVVAGLQDVSVDTSIYARRKDMLCAILTRAGFDFLEPKGAFYLFPKTPIADEIRFCSILQEEKILAVPGRGFGRPGHIRLAFCMDDRIIKAAEQPFARAFARAA
ncbi:MAG: aspartate aminotransferase [Deltaproteobacteria bacterium]|nr:MAG: aspartate aminotransferase [Deltaproteobacteria bacterium]